MPEEKLQTLSLQVINGSELESGRAARCLFTQQGNVGHGPECHWSVQDRQQSIPAQAFTVILHDGTFCLRPQTAQLWLNQAKVTATSDLIQLRQGDEIQIGRLMVRVHLNRGDIPHYDEEMATPETIVTNRDMLTDTLLSTEGAPHYLPSLFNGLVKAMNAAPPESEEKLAVLRVMRMLEDKSGRNNEVVKQYMAKRWSEKFHGQRDIQAQLMSHLDYALAHTDWHAERQAGDGDAISRWTPYDKPVVSAQKELSKLPVYQRVYQSLKTRALGVLPADLNLRDQVGPTFDQVFTSADDNKLVVPQFLTRYGLQSYFVKQRDELVELTAMDSWVLNLTRSVKYSDADRAEIQRQLTEQYISDYTATWRAGMDNLNIRNFESIGQLTGALEQVISGDQPLQRALTVLRDNTQPGVFSEKLSAKEREEALAEPDYQLLTRLGHEFAPENSTLAVQKDKESTMQAVYQQLTELHRYLLAIQNATVPGKSALKAVQLRLDQNSSDPIFATRQMAKTLPAPLNRWVGRLTDQAWHVVMVEAVHYMEVDWRDSVVKPFNEQLANNYPFNPRSAQDASPTIRLPGHGHRDWRDSAKVRNCWRQW